MKTTQHHILTLEIPRDRIEAVADRIETDWGLSVIQLERPGHDRSWLEMYFDQPGEAELAATVMKTWPEVKGSMIRKESPRDWQTFWRHHFHTTDIGRHLRIVPVWERETAPPDPQRHTIWLDPGLSFGTGDHFTTRFCLEMIDRLLPEGAIRTVLDIGTGSGILAIAARLLGAKTVIGTDNDATALEQTHENLALNDMTGRIDLRVADILAEPPQGSFDLVCANVYTSILVEASPAISACAKRYVVLSGIRDPELETVAAAYTGLGFEEIFRDGNGEWGGLAFERKNRKKRT